MLVAQGNIANTYRALGRLEDCVRMRQYVYSGVLKLYGEDNIDTLAEANNYAHLLIDLKCFEQAKLLFRKTIPVARRVLGESHELVIKMRRNNARALYTNTDATLDDLRKAVTTLEETDRIMRRVLGCAHPLTEGIETSLRNARAALRAREETGGA